jgi:hypothetical protein
VHDCDAVIKSTNGTVEILPVVFSLVDHELADFNKIVLSS